jgi:hypothetical protein
MNTKNRGVRGARKKACYLSLLGSAGPIYSKRSRQAEIFIFFLSEKDIT